jgi:serine/threonine protein kinase
MKIIPVINDMNTIQNQEDDLNELKSPDLQEDRPKKLKKVFKEGTLLGTRYKILEVLGTGGFGVVYKASDLVLDEIVALKVLDEKFSLDENSVERFKREIKLARKITHKNVVRIFDIDEIEGRSIITMEYFHGVSLKELLNKQGKLNIESAIDIGLQLCSALHVAHKNGVIHRDIKPQNILINDENIVKIVDFGIARSNLDMSSEGSSSEITKTGTIIGTPEYISPEQVKGDKNLDHRTDIYSLGIVLYEMFTGEVPFKGNTPIATILKRLNENPVLPSKLNSKIPPELERLILTAMAHDVNDRYNNIIQLSDDLMYFKELYSVGKRGESVTPVTKTGRFPKSVQTKIDELEKDGTRLYFEHKYTEAAAIFDQVLEIDPKHEKASHFYNKASQKREDVRDKFKEAQYYFKKGQFRACIKLLEEIISLYKNHSEAIQLIDKARKQLKKHGDKATDIRLISYKSRSTGLVFKFLFTVLLILTTFFIYLQYKMDKTPEIKPVASVEIKNEVNKEIPLPPKKTKANKTSKKKDRLESKKPQSIVPPPTPPPIEGPGFLNVTVPKLSGKKVSAKIYVDGNFLNYTPQARIKLDQGIHRLTLVYEESGITYKIDSNIEIKPEQVNIIKPIFTPADKN